jgi:hypothetical protein
MVSTRDPAQVLVVIRRTTTRRTTHSAAGISRQPNTSRSQLETQLMSWPRSRGPRLADRHPVPQVPAGSKTRAGLNAKPSSCPYRDPGDHDSPNGTHCGRYQQAAEHGLVVSSNGRPSSCPGRDPEDHDSPTNTQCRRYQQAAKQHGPVSTRDPAHVPVVIGGPRLADRHPAVPQVSAGSRTWTGGLKQRETQLMSPS